MILYYIFSPEFQSAFKSVKLYTLFPFFHDIILYYVKYDIL